MEGVQYLDVTIETLRKAIELRPNFPQAQNDLAFFLESAGDTAQSLEILRDVLANDPGLRDANVTYIGSLVDTGRFEDAEAALARWARIRPDAPDIRIRRVHLYSTQGRLADAWRESVEVVEAGASDTALEALRFTVRWRLRDGAWIIENFSSARRKAAGAILEGDTRRAVELVDGDPNARLNSGTALATYVPVHYAAGDLDAVIAYYEGEMKSPAGAMEASNYCGCSPLQLVLALKDSGHPDFQSLLEAWKRNVEGQSELYTRSGERNAERGDIAALDGDFAAAKKYYALAMDLGWRNPIFVSRNLRKFLPADVEFDALLHRMAHLINEERRSLGMQPIG
jgi:tetratricopeptide (TPR) repeat protein